MGNAKRWSRVMWGLVWGLGAAVVTAAPGDEPPVLLRSSQLLMPFQASGAGISPEIRVRVSIDERGRVTQVEALSIQPSSKFDEVFRESVREQLKYLRYSPARVGGKSQATQLEWTVKFQSADKEDPSTFRWPDKTPPAQTAPAQTPPAQTPPSPSSPPPPPTAQPKSQAAEGLQLRPPEILAAENRVRFQRLQAQKTLEMQKATLLRWTQICEKYLVRERRRQFQTANFLVITDARDERAAEWAAQNLEASHVFLDEFWRKDIEPMPTSLRTVVYLFQTSDQWQAMNRELQGAIPVFATYLSPGLIVGYVEMGSVERLLTFLIHEVSHAYSDHHLQPLGVGFPRWLEEGFAEYVANSKIEKGRLIPGKLLKNRFLYSHDYGMAFLVKTESGIDAQTLQIDLGKKNGITLPRLLTLEADEFYGDRFPVYYAASWVLIHFLQHGRPEWAPLFPKMMLYVAEGYPIAEVVPAVYGVDLQEMAAEYHRYAKDF